MSDPTLSGRTLRTDAREAACRLENRHPRATPKEVIAVFNAAVSAALAHKQIKTRLAGLGQDIYPPERRTPEALGAFHKAEIAKWWPIIKAAGIKAE